jgi:hypothetical protein
MFACEQSYCAQPRTVKFLVGCRNDRRAAFITQRIQMTSLSRLCPGSSLRAATGLAGVLLLSACASTPPAPTAQLQAAQQAITSAERADASRHAAGELSAARAKLAAANAAVQAEEMVAAERLAGESRVDAELATARAAFVKARIVNDEMQSSTGTLIDEMQRKSGDAK